MVVQGVVQMAFNLVLAASLVVMLIALFTPQWSVVEDPKNPGEKIGKGLISDQCTYFNNMLDKFKELAQGKTEEFEKVKELEKCVNFWDGMSSWEKFVLGMLIMSCMAAAAALVWSCITCGLCCCSPLLAVLLPILSLIAFTMSMAGTIVYISQNHSIHDGLAKDIVVNDPKATLLALKDSLGYSAFMAAFASMGMFVATVLSIFVLTAAKMPL